MKSHFIVLILLLGLAAARADEPTPAPPPIQPNDPMTEQLIEFAHSLGGNTVTDPIDDMLEKAKLRITSGARLDATNRKGLTALQIAAESSHLRAPEFMRLLLDHDASIDAVDAKGRTALMHAAMRGHDHNILFLVLAGASTTAEDVNKFTPLDHAVHLGHWAPVSPTTITVLTKGRGVGGQVGADPNHVASDGWTPLMRACQMSYGSTIFALLATGADPNYVAPDGWTPITVAIASDDERYWVQWMDAEAIREGRDRPVLPMYAAMMAGWARGNAGSPERVWTLMRIDRPALDIFKHQTAIDRVLKGRDDPSAAAVRALLNLDDDLQARPIDIPLFGNDGAVIPTPE